MLSFLKKTINSRRLITGVILVLFTIFTACDLSMGLGDPVDTENPSIKIVSPVDDEYFPSLTLGRPIEVTGIWKDNIGVTELRFEVRDMTNRLVESSATYTINPDGTWKAYLTIFEVTEGSGSFYSIKVFAYDKFKNDDLDVKTIRLDIVPPWVERANITRHPGYVNSENEFGTGFYSDLRDLDYYYGIGFDSFEAYRSIKWTNIDDYQNETFRLNLEIKSVFDVAASRLNIYDSFGVLINNAGSLKPTGNVADRRSPYWDITTAQLTTWRPELATGAHYITFEILAWNVGSWEGNEQDGQPRPDATVRIEDISGTCWYPESDIPHIYFDTSDMVNNIKVLNTNTASALIMDFYDDDRLGDVFYGLVKKEAFDTLRANAGMSSQSEDAYLQTLLTNTTNWTAAQAAIRANANQSSADQYNGEERKQDFPLSTVGMETGEYRLIALVRDGKPTGQGLTFPPGATVKSSVYPSIRIQVQDQNAPLVIIEKPERENVFPSLENDGEYFTISGYTLDRNGVNSIHIAWVTPRRAPTATTPGAIGNPTGLTVTHGEAAIRASTISEGGVGWSAAGANAGIKIWNLRLDDPTEMILNGVPYKRTNFSCTFHILNDFTYSRTANAQGDFVVNDEKLFVIVADNGNPITKTIRLDGTTQGPQIDIVNPASRHSYHDIQIDLDLKMLTSRGSSGVALQNNSHIIYNVEDGRNNGASFGNVPTTQNVNTREWFRTVQSTYIQNNYTEGSLKTYIFEAANILGITTTIERTVTMSNRPVLESIICSNGTGTYGIGKTLTFEATFSMSIRIPDGYYTDALRPRLRLYKTNPGTGQPAVSFYADMPRENGVFINQNGGTVLRFVYTINDGDDTTLLHTALDPIQNSSSIFSYQNSEAYAKFENHTNSLQNKTQIAIDATRPSILRASFVQLTGFTNGTSYFNNGKTLTLKLYASEQVQVSGAPIASVYAGAGTANRIIMTFSRVTTEGGRYVIYFTKVLSESDTIAASQVRWAAYNGLWIESNEGSISDVIGNPINNYGTLGGALSVANLNGSAANVTYPGNATVSYDSEQAYIKTTKPGAPTVGFFTAATGGTSLGTTLTGDPIRHNDAVYLSVTGTETNLRYSTEGGANPQNITGTTRAALPDSDRTNRHLNTYKPSTSIITAWQVDLAGNSSDIPQPRQVIINSRAPELQGVDVSLPDGWYPRGTAMTFKFYFSGVLRGTNITNPTTSTATATFTITGIDTSFTGSATITSARAFTESAGSSMLNVNWTVPAGLNASMRNIKISNLSFTNVTDEYGNALVAYSGTAAPNESRRPITNTDTFNMTRPGFGIRPAGPILTGTIPARPTGTAENSNGGLLQTGTTTVSLTFDTAVNPVPGKYITIKPYGAWAIPPILSTDEFDALYNYSFESGVKEQYQRWLKNTDGNELPLRDQGRGRDRTENFYIKNTHGLTSGGLNGAGNVRPDTKTKMVLNFNTGLYEGTNVTNLRTVFNAAKWKWQEIHVPSVTFENNDRITVRIPITALDKGRIWEVIIDEGAFTDDAGNPYAESLANRTFRFWTAGTENPVVRVEKISYDGNSGITDNVTMGYVQAGGAQNIPIIDTRVRIDCETPGAAVYYDTIRTRINFAGTTPLNPLTNTTTNTRDAFFGTGEGLNLPATNTGYANNVIGNDDVGVTANRDTEGFFSRLLVPNNRQSGTQNTALTNGTFPVANLVTFGANLRTNFGTAGRQWGSSNVNGSLGYIYIGDAWGATANTVANNTDTQLFTGRRDYIVAVARKNIVTTAGQTAGPALVVSEAPIYGNGYAGMEGVYKTILLYRQPRYQTTNNAGNNAVARLLVQGFDLPVIPVVAGFPLRDADINSPNDSAINNYFSKTAYRLNGTTAGIAYENANNCYIWITWEIVTDWYQKGKLIRDTGAGNYLYNTQDQWNQNSVAAPYGGIIYRYQQQFYNP